MKAKSITQALILLWAQPAFAANTVIDCGSTYYVPVVAVDATGAKWVMPASAVLVTASSDTTKVTASIGTMPSSSAPAVVVKPIAPGSGIQITVSDSSKQLLPGSAPFDAAMPQTIMLDVGNAVKTTP